jgi:polysaccharide pyruvyl transferase WcaK-like protein
MKIVQIGAKVGSGKGIGHGNAGDTAIGSAFNYLFEEEFPNHEITFMNCRKEFTKKDIEIINQHDFLIVSGGGLFLHDTFVNELSDWQWGINEKLIDEIKIPIIVYGVGYNKFRKQREFNKQFNKTINKLVEKSLFFGLRNTGSCESIKQHLKNSNHNKIKLSFCPTMLLNDKYKYHNTGKNKTVGFVFAGDRLTNRHENIEKFTIEIKNFVKYLKDKGYKTTLINHQNDLWILDKIKFDGMVDLYKKNTELIYQTYSKMDYVISDRGHAQMIPFCCGCKLLTPISHNKLKWFLNDMGIDYVGVEENTEQLEEKLISTFEKLEDSDWNVNHSSGMEKIKSNYSKNMREIKDKLNIH